MCLNKKLPLLFTWSVSESYKKSRWIERHKLLGQTEKCGERQKHTHTNRESGWVTTRPSSKSEVSASSPTIHSRRLCSGIKNVPIKCERGEGHISECERVCLDETERVLCHSSKISLYFAT